MVKKKATKKKATKKVAIPKYIFVGNGDSDPEVITFRGYEFKLNGPAVPVPDKAAAAKLSNNTHWKLG